MTEAERVIEECDRRGITLALGESSRELAYDAQPSALTPELREMVAAHKPNIIELLLDREERAALSGCPDWQDAWTWLRAVEHPATTALLEKFAPLGIEIVSLTLTKARKEEAA
jgi:TubC N-terminal docking domain